MVARGLVANLDELADGHELGAVDVKCDLVILSAAEERVRHGLGAVLARDVGHEAVTLRVGEDAGGLHVGVVVGDHGLGVLAVAHEDVVQALALDVLLGVDVVLLLHGGVGGVVGVDQAGVDDLLDACGLGGVDGILVSGLTLCAHKRHGDKRQTLGAREGFGKAIGVVEVGHARVDAHRGIRSERSLAVAAEDELVMRCELKQNARGLSTQIAVDAR